MKFTQVRFLCNVQRHSLNQVEYFVGKIKKYKENNLSPKFDFFTGWSNHVRWQGRLNSLEEASTSSLGFKSNKENWWSANSSSLLSACQININHVQWLLWIFEIIQTWISYTVIQQTSWNLDSSTTFSTAFGFQINLSVSEFWRRILLIILQ